MEGDDSFSCQSPNQEAGNMLQLPQEWKTIVTPPNLYTLHLI